MQKVLIFSPGRALTVLAAGLGGLQADAQLKSNMVPDATAGACVCVDTWLHGRCSPLFSHSNLNFVALKFAMFVIYKSWNFANYIFCTRKSEIWKLLKLTSCNLGDVSIWSFSFATLQALSRHLNPSAILRLGIWRKIAKEPNFTG